MANLYDTSATTALNDQQYINKLYDDKSSKQNTLLQENYKATVGQLDAGAQRSDTLSDAYRERTAVEAGAVANDFAQSAAGSTNIAGREAQAGLSFGNQRQKNMTALNQQQRNVDAEYERQRKLLADAYSAEIKKAQANNDMQRAEMLYEAAKKEEEQLRTLRQSAANLMAGKGDMSLWEAIGKGESLTPDTTTPTWEGIVDSEESINKIYDAQLEGQKLDAQISRDTALSDLEAKRKDATQAADSKLTEAYLSALRSAKNYRETQNAYGQSSGAAAAARVAQGTGLTEDLTDLRKLDMDNAATNEAQRLDAWGTYGDALLSGQESAENARIEALYKDASEAEQAKIEEQQALGQLLAEKGDYSVLGKLYGLTQEQIAALTPKRSSGGGGSSKKTSNKNSGSTNQSGSGKVYTSFNFPYTPSYYYEKGKPDKITFDVVKR